MTRKKLFLAGFSLYAVWLILTLPATLLDGVINQQTVGKVRLAEAKGTLWSGVAQLEFREVAGLAGLAQGIEWHVRPWTILTGALTVDITLDRSRQQFPVRIGMNSLTITNADIQLPAAALGMTVPKLKPFGLGGNMSVNVDSLNVSAGEVKGRASAEWRGATSTLTPVSPLGDYAFQYDSSAASPVVVTTLAGPLHVDGQQRGTAFLGTITVDEAYREKLSPTLRLISVERSPGKFDLKIE